MEAPELAADGLLLRGWRPDDAAAVHRACQDPEIPRWTTVPSPYLLEHGRDFVEKLAPDVWAEGSAAPFAVCDADSGELLGSCGLVALDRAGRWAEIGYWTAPWARCRGYLPAALAALCGWGFRMLGLVRIEWRAHLGNDASRRAAEKAGFVVEGTARRALSHRGRRVDAWVGAMVREEGTT